MPHCAPQSHGIRSGGLERRTTAEGQQNKDTEDAVEALWCSPARYLWAMLLARIYELAPLACPQYSSDMRIIAFVTDGASVRSVLAHIGEPTDPQCPLSVSM